VGVDEVKRRAVFLDRDGVLNSAVVRGGKPHPPIDVSELRLCDGVPGALEELRAAGFLLIVVTNQPDVARGTMERSRVEDIHETLRKLLPLDDIRVCYHDDADRCECRKPRPGMILDAAREWDIDTRWSFMVGDRWRDVDAGRNAGCTTILVGDGYAGEPRGRADVAVASLPAAAAYILSEMVRGNLEGPQ
jgi:D-glycero-D-manno-heptose 1,7-bisphosphate phosphatase